MQIEIRKQFPDTRLKVIWFFFSFFNWTSFLWSQALACAQKLWIHSISSHLIGYKMFRINVFTLLFPLYDDWIENNLTIEQIKQTIYRFLHIFFQLVNYVAVQIYHSFINWKKSKYLHIADFHSIWSGSDWHIRYPATFHVWWTRRLSKVSSLIMQWLKHHFMTLLNGSRVLKRDRKCCGSSRLVWHPYEIEWSMVRGCL